MEHLREKTLSSTEIYNGNIIKVSLDEVELPNGHTSKREIVRHPGAVAIIALTDEKKLLLVRQYRKPLDMIIYEIPAGKLEPGEKPFDCARRELEEETGYKSDSIKHIQSFYTSPGFADEIVHVYYTDRLEKLENSAGLDDDEFLDLLEVTLDEAGELIEENKIYDAKTVYAVQYLQLKQSQGLL
ncbi:NTP pyrophosphohydrolase [Schinkia azotoformans MEV2011]|uniref:NTP pyrophosphohydrolase n=1 Tax=Schinkia azotoformans MEV2011 TaxID=1348973 RepID=A0A072NIL4_SCHAZ|nr:NUDIX hydrolase [Schinkia azotoformans]KEF37351.1 NTP pyrophosphohydrolase [Schinkia azotoformans MEV2011]MEC1694575.1 NUDIX hydrolase [Schinkia azotoformans]MEC1718337.1 NUDIX hydrolase [Schinkia azotoformans]MEC1725636.1 NUDIX hydrolase [Schinkia azotoformans]MEC1742578.1 NUDIX hydrolase [Schinkia azotoformans]